MPNYDLRHPTSGGGGGTGVETDADGYALLPDQAPVRLTAEILADGRRRAVIEMKDTAGAEIIPIEVVI